jgi:periplasmic protein TonB
MCRERSGLEANGETADFSIGWKADGPVVTLSAPMRSAVRGLGPAPRRRWIGACLAALILHLMVLAALLLVPRDALHDNEAAEPMAVTLVTEPPAAEAAPAPAPPVETPPVEPPPPLVVPPPEPPPEIPPPPELTPPPDVPPPPEAAPVPDVPPPPPPPPPRAAAKPAPARPRPAAPPPSPAPASSAPGAEPRAPVPSAAPADVIGPYRNSLAAHVQPYQRYPALARARREEGLVVLHVTIERDGRIAAMSIEHGSGSESLDREALATLKRADPLPPVPPSLPGATIDLVFPLRFHLE